MIPNPWLILGAVIFLLVSHGWAFHAGKKSMGNEIKAEQLEATSQAIEEADKQAVVDSETIKQEAQVQEKIRIVYRTIREKANENIDKNTGYAECTLDDDGLRLFNSKQITQTDNAGNPPH